MTRRYWLDVFSGTGWEQFLKIGANLTGFRKRKEKVAKEVRPGDYFLCYISGISRFTGVTEALTQCYIDHTPLSKSEELPVRFMVKLVHRLEPENAVPLLDMNDRLFLFVGVKELSDLASHFKGCPMELEPADGKVILTEIEKALKDPVPREYDKARYWRSAAVPKDR